jgi:hypothetical protein
MNFSSARRLAGDGRLTHHTHNQKEKSIILFKSFKHYFKNLFFLCVCLSRRSKWKHWPLVYKLTDGACWGVAEKTWNGSRSFFFFCSFPTGCVTQPYQFRSGKNPPDSHHARTIFGFFFQQY